MSQNVFRISIKNLRLVANRSSQMDVVYDRIDTSQKNKTDMKIERNYKILSQMVDVFPSIDKFWVAKRDKKLKSPG